MSGGPTTTGTGQELGACRNEYAAWLATPQRLRRQLGLPSDDLEFGELKGVNPRTLRRWKQRPDVLQWVEQHKRRIAGQVDGAAVAAAVGGLRTQTHGNAKLAARPSLDEVAVTQEDDPVYDPSLSREEQLYQQAKDSIFTRAADGDANAFDLMMKYWGKEFVTQERMEAEQFEHMSDEDLVAEVLGLLGEDSIARVMAAKAAA